MISTQIIRIASDTTNYGIKRKSNYLASSKNKICGDRITVEVEVHNNIIENMYYETESCVFCQASASLLSKIVMKKSIKELFLFIDDVKKKKTFVKKQYKPLKCLFQKKYKERIGCVMLPFNALMKAINTTV